MTSTSFSATDLLRLDASAEVNRITEATREIVLMQFKRKGAVVAISGGIDSSVVAALCVRALGSEHVLGLFLPETDSSADSLRLGKLLAEALGIRAITEDITPLLQAAGCYRRRDEAIRSVVPEYGPGWKSKIVLPNLVEADRYAVFSLVVQTPSGEFTRTRMPIHAYLGVLAATNFKQRTRKMMEYYHADHNHYAVAGTPNRLEYDLGFFVKNGDGAADFKPIAHLYKSQVYQLAAELGIPQEIQHRPPTTDTYSLEQSQEEFYFSMPLAKMDLCLYGKDHALSPSELAPMVGLTSEQVSRVYDVIDSKRKVARYLQMAPVLACPLE
jgi:NAD+ synthase